MIAVILFAVMFLLMFLGVPIVFAICAAGVAAIKAGGVSIPLTLILVLVLYVGGEVINGVTLSDNVSQLTHIIGGLCGAFLGLGMRR